MAGSFSKRDPAADGKPTIHGSDRNSLKGQYHEMDIFWKAFLILISTFLYALMVFQVIQKFFTTLYIP